MPMRPYLHRFLRKFVLDAVPGALASVVGALLFAHQWAPAPPTVRAETVERVALQSEQVAQMIRDEHALMVEFLRKEQEREAARQPLPTREFKAHEAASAARRAAEAVAEAKAPSASEAKAPAAVPPARPEVAVVAFESGPLVAPDRKPEAEPESRPESKPELAPAAAPSGAFARIAAVAAAWTELAVDVSGVRQIPALIRAIPPRADAASAPLDTLSGARLVSASR